MLDDKSRINGITVLDINSFHLIEGKLLESGLIFQKFTVDEEDCLLKLKNKFQRNKAKIFVEYNVDRTIISFVVLVSEREISIDLGYKWQIAYLYVSPEYRRLKKGEKLLRYVIDYASLTRAKSISLYTNEDNFNAINLYRKFNFIETKFLANYIWFKLDLDNK